MLQSGRRHAKKSELETILAPSTFVRTAAPLFASVGGPVLDLAGGSGRHAFYLAQFNIHVDCLDLDLGPYCAMQRRLSKYPHLLSLVSSTRLDLSKDHWPFVSGSVGGIVMVDFLLLSVFQKITDSLATDGLFLVQTVGNHGNNYLQLPKAEILKEALSNSFTILHYDERRVGPSGADAVTVRLLARRL